MLKTILKKTSGFCLFFIACGAHADGVKSAYSEIVKELAKKDQIVSEPLSFRCWSKPEQDLYMGVEQRLQIKAPFDQVVKVVGDFDHYADLFPGYKKIKAEAKEGNTTVVLFEQKVPMIFVPNILYRMNYEITSPKPDRKLFVYQLKEAGTIKASDGFILLTKRNDQLTDYVEYDFFDADWGMASVMGKVKLWSDVVKGFYHSDLATKEWAEHPDLSAEDARQKAKESMDSKVVDECVKNRQEWPKTLSASL